MRRARFAAVALVIAGISSVTLAQDFQENFDSYPAGTVLHHIGGWKGWDDTPDAAGRVSDMYAFSGTNSVEILGACDLVHEFTITEGRWNLSAMQYIASGSTGQSYFIILNQYRDGGQENYDAWSVQTEFDLDNGIIKSWSGDSTATILYDRWVEVKCTIDLVADAVYEYYNGELSAIESWGGAESGASQALDLFANNASSVFYDDIKLERCYIYKATHPEPVDGATNVDSLWLRWARGDGAVRHNVYIGTTWQLTAADLRVSSLDCGPMYPCSVPMIPGMTYYWRVDEVMADGTVITGDVWRFTTTPNTAYDPHPRNGDKWIDPNTTLTWMQDQYRASHRLYFGADRAAVAARDPSVFKGELNAMRFEPGSLAQNTTYYWAVDEYYVVECSGDLWSFTTTDGLGGGVKAEYFRGTNLTDVPFVTRIEPAIDHFWGQGEVAGGLVDAISARWTADLEVAATDRYTFVTNTDDGVRLWLDDRLLIDDWTDRGFRSNVSEPVQLDSGIYSLRMEWFEQSGSAAASLSWQSPTLPCRIIPGGPLQPLVHARAFYPPNAAYGYAPQDTTLMWQAGERAVTHDVYFGTDKAAVAAATVADANIYRGSRALADTYFYPGPLERSKTYYWRVDEVNDAAPSSPWKGMVWSFITAFNVVVDNFESYTNDSPHRLFQMWIDGRGFPADEYFTTGNPGNGTGSVVGHNIWAAGTAYNTIAETTIVASGRQSMPIGYNNLYPPYYSEVGRTWTTPQDLTGPGLELLMLAVHGSSGNQPARLYMALEDNRGNTAAVTHADDGLVTSPDWKFWAISLSDFAGVDAAAIRKISIGVDNRDTPAKGGTGTIFIDFILVGNLRRR